MSRVAPFGVLLLDKPEGPTSHDLVGWVRWGLGVRQVGHCGTLDPAASGLLVVCVGPATRFVSFLTGVDKRYRARIVLGVSTDSADREGAELARVNVPDGVASRVPEVLAGMQGALELPPPIYSAIKVDGQRAHRLARGGEDVVLEPRPMTVHECRVESVERIDETIVVDAEMTVSKGTYIRSLAVELGRRLGVPAHLGGLRRLSCGALSLAGDAPVIRVDAAQDQAGRWRCRSADQVAESTNSQEPESRRGRAREALSAALIDPAVALPIPVLELDDVPPELGGRGTMTMLARLSQGQTVGLSPGEWVQLCRRDEALAELGAEPRQLCLRARDDEGRSAIIVVANATREPSEADATPRIRVRPERVVRAVSQASSKASSKASAKASSQARGRSKKPHRQP